YLNQAIPTRISFFSAIFCGLSLLVGSAGYADEVLLYDSKKISGKISAIDSKVLTVQVGKESQKFSLFDVTSYRFMEPALPQNVSQLLIDGEKTSYSTGPRSAKVKLRKGFHRFTLPYYHTTGLAKLNITMSGPNMKKAEIPKEMLYRVDAEVRAIPTRDYKVDKEGYRLPLDLKQPQSYVAYRLLEWKPPEEVKSLQDLGTIPVKRYGASPRLAMLTRRSAIYFGIVYEGLIKIPQDGEYTFSIEADNNSKMKFYLGAYPSELYKQAKGNRGSGWRVIFSEQGELAGEIKEWNKDQNRINFAVQVADKELEVALKTETVHELWKIHSDAKQAVKADRKGESETEDSAYISTKDGNVQKVSGEVVGMNETSLLFQYQGQEREVNLDRVVGLVLQKKRLKKATNLTLQSLVSLIGGAQIPGELTLDQGAKVLIKLPGGAELALTKDDLASVKTVNARSVSLTELIPETVTQVPFFNQVYPYQVNQSFTGKPLKVGSQVFSKGLCVHSRTVLVYTLDRNFEKFQTSVGLQAETGQLGNVAVKVVADGKTLYEKPEFTSTTQQTPLNLDVTGCQTLTLVVDFGKDQDVGDRFVWGDPKLIRAVPKELTANKN
ncbi:MAG: NPCBM/NEW2 domain-containing protein, partial [Planctomycetaceae bacterium]|nr:NPCBM/NEW2 domain-containing protein [Planctomycetaceae bacterium]